MTQRQPRPARPPDPQALVQRELSAVRRLIRRSILAGADRSLRRLALAWCARQGKGIRPALVLLVARRCGRIRPDHRRVAAAVELFHAATLLHDDVLDQAGWRRSGPSFNARFGNQQAVLLGDFLFSTALELIDGLPGAAERRLFTGTARTVCAGEISQVAGRGRLDVSRAEYRRIIGKKTASLFAVAARLAARISGQPPAAERALAECGRQLGLAFQVADDCLDCRPGPLANGKPAGVDLLTGTLTLPLIHLRERCSPAERRRLAGALAGKAPAGRRQVLALLAKYGSLDYARRQAGRHLARARRLLAGQPPPGHRPDVLLPLLDAFAARL